MIYALEGIVSEKGDGFFILVCGGVFLCVRTDALTLENISISQQKKKVSCVAYIRDGEQVDLFGFLDNDRRDLFLLLRSVSGVGSRMALNVLGLGETARVRAVIAENEADVLSRVSGVGKRTAERITLELKGKVASIDSEQQVFEAKVDRDVEQALVGLGYGKREVLEALGKVDKNLSTFEDKVRSTLKEISK
jgi:holliday junction DNA helicase RuvA